MNEKNAGGWDRNMRWMVDAGALIMSATQRQAGETLELMGRSTQAKVGLLQQAMRAAQDPNPLSSQAKWMGFWLSAVGIAQTNTASALGIHTRAFNSWLRIMTRH